MPIAKPSQPIKLYGVTLSGHAHRIVMFLSMLDLPYEAIPVDLAAGAHKQPDFLRLNLFGQVPVIDDAGTIVADSNAILVYLATRYAAPSWLPRDAVGAAEVQRWLSVAAGQIAYGPCAARLVTVFGAPLDHARATTISNELFAVMDRHLATRPFLIGATPTIADISGYPYVAHAPEGGVSLAPHTHIRSWLARIEALPGFVAMPASKAGLVA